MLLLLLNTTQCTGRMAAAKALGRNIAPATCRARLCNGGKGLRPVRGMGIDVAALCSGERLHNARVFTKCWVLLSNTLSQFAPAPVPAQVPLGAHVPVKVMASVGLVPAPALVGVVSCTA